MQPQRITQAEADLAAKEPGAKLLLLCGVVILTFGVTYSGYAVLREQKGAIEPAIRQQPKR